MLNFSAYTKVCDDKIAISEFAHVAIEALRHEVFFFTTRKPHETLRL